MSLVFIFHFDHLIAPNILLFCRSVFAITEDDVVFMASPLTFDPSVVEMFMTWSQGASLLIVPTKLKVTPSSLAQVLRRNHVTVLQVGKAACRERLNYGINVL